ncbi:tRNA-His guanylyltransferase [Ceratobasidium sp. 428]|nr:tRNA-His guanylyltransferase [Ceratobasidium sp. 428]
MANSRFAYVRSFELPDPLLPNTYMVLRIDGHVFHKFSDAHEFQKPNDERALCLMDKAAQTLMEEYPDIMLAFGESDEYRSVSFNSSPVWPCTEASAASYLKNLASYIIDAKGKSSSHASMHTSPKLTNLLAEQ